MSVYATENLVLLPTLPFSNIILRYKLLDLPLGLYAELQCTFSNEKNVPNKLEYLFGKNGHSWRVFCSSSITLLLIMSVK